MVIIKAYRLDGAETRRFVDVPVRHQSNIRDATAMMLQLAADNSIVALKFVPQFGNGMYFIREEAHINSVFPTAYYMDYIPAAMAKFLKQELAAAERKRTRESIINNNKKE